MHDRQMGVPDSTSLLINNRSAGRIPFSRVYISQKFTWISPPTPEEGGCQDAGGDGEVMRGPATYLHGEREGDELFDEGLLAIARASVPFIQQSTIQH